MRADDPATLNANLASLAGAEVLDLPEKEAREDATKIEAVLRWLEAHPTWLLILDNVDDAGAVAAVTKLMPRLTNGHVIVTARATIFPAGLRKLEVDVLDEGAATRFLLDRTREERVAAPDDEASAREIAREFDGLALGLEQAGAYIATEKIGFARYLKLWKESRDKVVGWSLTGSEKTLATVWATSFDRLSPESRRLLDRLAMLAPDPIPDSLLDVAVPGEADGYDAYAARAGLYAYSLIDAREGRGRLGDGLRHASPGAGFRAAGDDGGASGRGAAGGVGLDQCRVRRRSQRRAKLAGPRPARAARARGRAAGGRGGDRGADGTAPRHARALVQGEGALRRGRAALSPRAGDRRGEPWGRTIPTRRPASTISRFCSDETNRHGEAEPLYRRALAIARRAYGPDHPDVAIRLNNLANLLRATNRLGEAEPLYRRALAICEASYGPDHPESRPASTISRSLLQATNRPGEAEPLFRRALAIDEASFGPDHPNVATDLNNLACLLKPQTASARRSPSIAARWRFTRRARVGPSEHGGRARPPCRARGRARPSPVSGDVAIQGAAGRRSSRSARRRAAHAFKVSSRSFQRGLSRSMRASLSFRLPDLICFSRAIASSMRSCGSSQTRSLQPYRL